MATNNAIRTQAKTIVGYYKGIYITRKDAYAAAKADGVLKGDFGKLVDLYFETSFRTIEIVK